MDILFTVQPGPNVKTFPSEKVTVEIDYIRIVVEDGNNERVPSSTRVDLDPDLKGSINLQDVDSNRLVATVLAMDGSTLIERTVQATDGTATLTLSVEDVEKTISGQQITPTDTVPPSITRTARLVPTGSVRVDYLQSMVIVVQISDAEEFSKRGLDTLLKSDGTRISSLEVTGQNLSNLTGLPWSSTHLAVDGTFTAQFTQKPSIGWVWWLIGEHQVLGFIPDDLNVVDNKNFVIVLPALSASANTGSATTGTTPDGGRSVPANVTEAEIANNPDIYSEDPGAFCRPFSNPERVLSEKSFSVIARATQPEVGSTSSVRSNTMTLLTLDGLANSSTLSSRELSSGAPPTGSLPAPVVLGDIVPTRHRLADRYVELLKRLPSGRLTMDANHPVQWEDEISQYQAATVAIGHILEFRVRWRANGYSLGNVAKTLTLAPRQTKRIQKIEWERSERARRREITQLRDQENDSLVRERDYSDTVSASLNEWASGSSSSDTEAIAGGIGFFASGILGGIGGGAGSAHSSSHQEGGRDTTASELQRLRDAIRRHGDALRKFESTVVNEVTQEETVTGTTEVIRNPNYAHSLTVIYYQILRHLKVTTEFAGVRECVFIPFAIKPFDLQRAYRWREALQAYIRSPLYSRALRYLKDVLTNFSTSDIAPGPRAGQQLTYLRGSLLVSLGIERPQDTADGLFDLTQWQVVQPILGTPAQGIFAALLAQSAAQRDRVFQAEHAPGMASRWADKIQLKVGSRVLQADCTLATRYQFNRTVRIDFVVSAGELVGLSRQALQQITIVPQQDLPPGSVANLTRVSVTYNTDRFEHSAEGRTGTNDLISPATGKADNAAVVLPLDNWERVDEQLEIRRSVERLIEHLNEHVEYYHKAVWWHMDRDRLLMLLDGFYVPNTNRVSIASLVDREPVGIIGNSLVYRVGAASFLGYGKITTPAELYNLYAQKQSVLDPLLVSLPTDGLYAQTIMDECDALEEHYGNSDWVLNDKEPDLGTIDPSLLQSRRADSTPATTPTPFPGTIINLQNAPEAPAPSGLQGVLNAVTNPNAFRDMAGLAATQANAQAALNTAANLATNFGNQAAALELAKLAKADQATKTADQKIASIKRAVDKGLATPEDAAQAARDVLSAMNPDSPKAQAPHENAAINSAIDTVRNIPGSTIEANTGEGAVRVQVGDGQGLLASLGGTIPQLCAFFERNTNKVVTEADLRDQIRQVTEAEKEKWFDSTANKVIEEDVDAQFGNLVIYWLCKTSDIPPTTLTALQTNALDPHINYDKLLKNSASAATVNSEAQRVRADLLVGVPGAAMSGLDQLVETALKDAHEAKKDAKAWSAVFVVSEIRQAAINLGLEGDGTVHYGKESLLKATDGHRFYVIEAFNRAQKGTRGTYHAFAPNKRAVQVGDIIIQDRQAKKPENVWLFKDIPGLAGGREMHGDIVIEVNDDNVITMGGNVHHSVRKRRYPIDADGKLIVKLEQYFVQEDDNGGLDPIPALKTAADAKAQMAHTPDSTDLSTIRIFAILSLVPECIVVPGTRVDGGVIT